MQDRCPCKKMAERDFGQTCRGKRPWEARTQEKGGAGRSHSLFQSPEVGREEERCSSGVFRGCWSHQENTLLCLQLPCL